MNLLKDIYNRIESLKGKPLLIFLGVIFIVFIAVGITVGYFTNSELNQDETAVPPQLNQDIDVNKSLEFTGRIQYVDPVFYPDDKISYILVDSKGKEIILLKSGDEKLKIAEGLTVKVLGTKTKSVDGTKDVLMVEEVQVNSIN